MKMFTRMQKNKKVNIGSDLNDRHVNETFTFKPNETLSSSSEDEDFIPLSSLKIELSKTCFSASTPSKFNNYNMYI